MHEQSWTVVITVMLIMYDILQQRHACVRLGHFSVFFSLCCAVGSGRTGKPGEDVVAVAVGSMAYGSAAGSLQWYGWLASTGRARWHRRTRQTDRQESF